jgi:Na+/serine symporter
MEVGNMIFNILPGTLWVVALFWSLGICSICIANGALRKRTDPRKVPTVQWSVVIMQVVSLVLCCVPYGIYKICHAQISNQILYFYASSGIPSAVLLGTFFVAELVLMYLQARRAQYDIIDDVLAKRHLRS